MIEDRKDFNALVDMAMADSSLSTMRPVVEKELLHYEIFHALDGDGLLKYLVFQGGTSLRLCRGSNRFSEDLDFAGGVNFSAAGLERIKLCIEEHIGERFGLNVTVSPKPARLDVSTTRNVRVDKWWVSIETSPENPALPRQRIKLEVANIPAYTKELVPLRINYAFLQGMPTVLVNTESINEVMADKVLAFPTSLKDKQGRDVANDSAKIRHRDLWDLAWMNSRGATLIPGLVVKKISDYGVFNYLKMLDNAIQRIPEIVKSREFSAQMSRFIDSSTIGKTLKNEGYLEYVQSSVGTKFKDMRNVLAAMPKPEIFPTQDRSQER